MNGSRTLAWVLIRFSEFFSWLGHILDRMGAGLKWAGGKVMGIASEMELQDYKRRKASR